MSLTIADARRWRSMAMASPRAPGKIGDSGWEDRYAEVMAAGLSRRPTRRRVAFWLLASVFAATMTWLP
jgi:hypothetical protein